MLSLPSYSLLFCIVVLVCAGEDCFKKYENRYFTGSARTAFTNTSVARCLAKCLVEKTFVCRSVTFFEGSGECFLNSMDKKQDPKNYIVLYKGNKSDYYQRLCFGKERRRAKAYAALESNECFHRIPGKVLIGVVDQLVQDVSSEAKCQKLCEKQDKSSEFVCKAVMYYAEEQECILASQTRHDMPDLFITDPKAVYFENHCIAVAEHGGRLPLEDEYSDLAGANETQRGIAKVEAAAAAKTPTADEVQQVPAANAPVPSKLLDPGTSSKPEGAKASSSMDYPDYPDDLPNSMNPKTLHSEPVPVPVSTIPGRPSGCGAPPQFRAPPSECPTSSMYPAQPPRYQLQSASYLSQPPVYQPQSSAYQSQPPAYQAPPPVYQAPLPSYQAPQPSYQTPPSTYQAPPSTYQAPPPMPQMPVPKPQCCRTPLCCVLTPSRSPCPQMSYNSPPPQLDAYATPRSEFVRSQTYVHEGGSNGYAAVESASYVKPGHSTMVEPSYSMGHSESSMSKLPTNELQSSFQDKDIPAMSKVTDAIEKTPKRRLAGIVLSGSVQTSQGSNNKLCYRRVYSVKIREDYIIQSYSADQCKDMCRLCKNCLPQQQKCIAVAFSSITKRCAMSSLLPFAGGSVTSSDVSAIEFYEFQDQC